MNRISLLSVIFGILILFSCKDEAKKPTQPVEKTPPAVDMSQPEIPGVTQEVMIRLLDQCTYVDYIFHSLPYSISQNEDPSIDMNVSFIDYKRPLGRIPKDCKPIGRKFFHIKGEIVYDVDVYLSSQCRFYVFVDKNNKPLFANYMTEDGLKFYADMASRARGAVNQ